MHFRLGLGFKVYRFRVLGSLHKSSWLAAEIALAIGDGLYSVWSRNTESSP